jgi:hypothetical protein
MTSRRVLPTIKAPSWLLYFSSLHCSLIITIVSKFPLNLDHVCLPSSRSKKTAMLINEHLQALKKRLTQAKLWCVLLLRKVFISNLLDLVICRVYKCELADLWCIYLIERDQYQISCVCLISTIRKEGFQ